MITGSCLCGGVRFEIEQAAGPFELCHCSRCRKSSGSAFFAGLGVRTEDFRLLAGRELIRSYEAPILERPPAYRKSFCSRCGSPVPDPDPASSWFEIPAGLLDDDPGVRPDRHIFVELRAPWFEITDDLPQLTKPDLAELRAGSRDSWCTDPRLETERLALRPCRLDDLAAIHRLWTMPETLHFLFDDRVISLDEARAFVQESERRFQSEGSGIWLVFERSSPELAGFAGLHVFSLGEPELLYGVRPDLWGSGLATEAARLVLDYCFKALGLPRMIASVDEPNLASVRVLEKLGMRFFKRVEAKPLPLLYFETTASRHAETSSDLGAGGS